MQNFRTWTTPVLALLASATLVACDSAALNAPDAEFLASGTVMDPDGTSWSSGEVGIWKFNPLEFVLTLGVHGFTSMPPDKTGSTNGQGAYNFSYLGKETVVVGVPSHFTVATRGLPFGAASASFELADGSQELKPLYLWNGIQAPAGSPTLAHGGDLEVAWSAAPESTVDPVDGYTVAIWSSAAEAPLVWSTLMSGSAASESIDQIVLPSGGAEYRVSVTARYQSGNRSWTESRLFVSDHAHQPLAGEAVTASENGADAQRAADGDLATAWSSSAAQSERDVSLTVDLGASHSLDEVILHGVSAIADSLLVETSEDGQSFSSAGTYMFEGGSAWVRHPFMNGTSARHVRVRVPGTTSSVSVAEVRVFAQ